MAEGDSRSGRGCGHFHDARLPGVSLLELVESLSEFLCAFSRQRGRDRWWFLRGKRFTEAETFVDPLGNVWTEPSRDRRTQVVETRVLFEAATPTLFVLVRVVWNTVGRSTKPTLLVDVSRAAPRMDARVSRAIGAVTKLAVEVKFGQQGRPAGIFTKKAIRGMSPAQRRELNEKSLRWQRSKHRTRELLRIDPRLTDSRRATTFLLLLYLWQRKMIDLDPTTEPEAWKFIRDLLARWHVTDDQEAFLILSALRGTVQSARPHRFAFPERAAALFKYITRVVQTLRRADRSRELPVGPGEIERLHSVENETGEDERLVGIENAQPGPVWLVAERLGVRSETIYRWIKGGRLRETRKKTKGRGPATLWLDAEALKIAKCRVRETTIRKRIREYLVSRGATPAAAKKRIQRWLTRGGTLDGLAQSHIGLTGRGRE